MASQVNEQGEWVQGAALPSDLTRRVRCSKYT